MLTQYFHQDGILTNIDFEESRILSDHLNSGILDNVYVGRTNQDGSSKHAGKFSDFNLWDYALPKNLMLKWTSCK